VAEAKEEAELAEQERIQAGAEKRGANGLKKF